MTPEMADADDRDANGVRRHAPPAPAVRRSRSTPRWPTRRPGRRRAPASCPASIDSAVAPATRIAWIVASADHRHVEAHVLIRLGHLDDADAGPGQVPGAANHLVGAFHGLDRDDRLVLDRDRLADVEAGDRVRHAVAEVEVRALLVGRRPRAEHALARQQRRSGTTVESSSSMPSSRMTSATAEMSASVLRALSRVSTDSRVRSGMMPEKILT